MKRTLAITLVALTLAFSGCKSESKVEANQPTLESHLDSVKEGIAKGYHLCNAPTKRGGKCTRKVSNGKETDSDVERKCWQHRDK